MDINTINYMDYGQDKKGVIVLLHGWGQNIEMMNMLGEPFQEDFRIIVIDFPGFGKSPEPDKAWSVEDYTTCLFEFLKEKKVENPILIGHSFGGRVSICYASKYKTKKVVLLSSPYRPIYKKPSKKTIIYKKVKKIKLLKPLATYLKKKWGSADYNNASDIMRGTLVKVINEDLTENAKKITCPVVLIYGENDIDVKLEIGKELENLIKDSGLIVYPGCSHYAYLEDLNKTLSIIDSFIK